MHNRISHCPNTVKTRKAFRAAEASWTVFRPIAMGVYHRYSINNCDTLDQSGKGRRVSAGFKVAARPSAHECDGCREAHCEQLQGAFQRRLSSLEAAINNSYVTWKLPYAAIPPALVSILVDRGVGRNGWAVMCILAQGVHRDGRIDAKAAAYISSLTGLTKAQVSRGIAELRERGVIVPVAVANDRSNCGHDCNCQFTSEVWAVLSDHTKKMEKEPE